MTRPGQPHVGIPRRCCFLCHLNKPTAGGKQVGGNHARFKRWVCADCQKAGK